MTHLEMMVDLARRRQAELLARAEYGRTPRPAGNGFRPGARMNFRSQLERAANARLSGVRRKQVFSRLAVFTPRNGQAPLDQVFSANDRVRLMRATNGCAAGSEGEVIRRSENRPDFVIARLWDGGVQQVPLDALEGI